MIRVCMKFRRHHMTPEQQFNLSILIEMAEAIYSSTPWSSVHTPADCWWHSPLSSPISSHHFSHYHFLHWKGASHQLPHHIFTTQTTHSPSQFWSLRFQLRIMFSNNSASQSALEEIINTWLVTDTLLKINCI